MSFGKRSLSDRVQIGLQSTNTTGLVIWERCWRIRGRENLEERVAYRRLQADSNEQNKIRLLREQMNK